MSKDHPNPDDLALLERAVATLSRRPGFMAHALALAFAGDASADRVSSEFGCSRETAVRLALMRVPREELHAFRDDISRLVEASGVDRVVLVSVVRQAQALNALGDLSDDGAHDGILLAARDVVPGSDEKDT